MSSSTRIAIAGAAGRMGRALVELSQTNEHVTVCGGFEHPDSPFIGSDLGLTAGVGKLNVPILGSIDALGDSYDVLIDFTLPESTLANVAHCRELGKRMVIGTTGFGEQKSVVEDAGNDIAVVFAPNMSIGVNLCFKLTELAAAALGDDVDIEIIEAHHRHKVDAPSGTAVRLGEIIADTLDRDLSKDAVYGREGRTGERERRTIGFETIRAGDIVGDHTVMFAGAGERIEITHRASSRMTFAAGALRAAAWLMSRDKGIFDMQDVLNLR